MKPLLRANMPSPDLVIRTEDDAASVGGMTLRPPLTIRRVLLLESVAPGAAPIRETLAGLFADAAIHVAANAAQAHLMLFSIRPQLAVLDLNAADRFLPYISHQALAQDPAVRLLVVAGHEDDDRILPALRAGAAGYVLRGDDAGAQRKRLRAALLGVIPLVPALARQILRHGQRVKAPEALDDIECALLERVAAGDAVTQVSASLGRNEAAIGHLLASIYRKVGLASAAGGAP